MLAAAPAPGALAAEPGTVYVVQGLPGMTADITIDGARVAAGVRTKTVVGPLRLAPGRHTVALTQASGPSVSATVTVTAGVSTDVIAYWSAEAARTPRIVVSPNDLTPVGRGKTRLVVTHGIVGPPADITVGGRVLFHSVANGESLSLLVPAGTYGVAAVTTLGGQTLLPKVQLTVAPGTLTRVIAIGAPPEHPGDAVVQVLPVPVTGAARPSSVRTGDGGQAAGLFTPHVAGGASPPVLAALLAAALAAVSLLLAALLAVSARRGAASPGRTVR